MSIYTVYLRGSNFRPVEAQAVVLAFSEDDPLLLEREPSNQFDPNAIRVIEPNTTHHVGYVAKEFASEIAPLMDAGATATCKVAVPNGKGTILEIEVTE